MEEHFVWMTTRRIKPGTLAEFERAWRPDTHPDGMLRAYAYWSEDEQQIIGVSFWDSKESCDAWRASGAEARRREAMAPHVVDEQEADARAGGNGGRSCAATGVASSTAPSAREAMRSLAGLLRLR